VRPDLRSHRCACSCALKQSGPETAQTVSGPSSNHPIPIERKDLMLLAFITLTVIIAAFLVYGIFIVVMEAAISEGFGK
jgi:hypothetical protein